MGIDSVEKLPIFDVIELGKKWEMPKKKRDVSKGTMVKTNLL